MYNGNVQQNPLCVESCVTKEFSISPRFSPTIFYPDANSVLLQAHLDAHPVLLRAHLRTAVDSIRAENPVFQIVYDESVKVYLHVYNGNVQQNPHG